VTTGSRFAFIDESHGGGPGRPERGRGWRRIRVGGSPPPTRQAEWAALLGFVLLPLLAGVSAAIVTVPSVHSWYRTLKMPPGTPPGWLFGPVWTVLYISMGVAAWLVWRRVARIGATPARLRPLRIWGWQVGVNALWSPAFFGLHGVELGLLILVPLVALVGWTVQAFRPVSTVAAWLLVPYFGWVCYATYLNAGLAVLNPLR